MPRLQTSISAGLITARSKLPAETSRGDNPLLLNVLERVAADDSDLSVPSSSTPTDSHYTLSKQSNASLKRIAGSTTSSTRDASHSAPPAYARLRRGGRGFHFVSSAQKDTNAQSSSTEHREVHRINTRCTSRPDSRAVSIRSAPSTTRRKLTLRHFSIEEGTQEDSRLNSPSYENAVYLRQAWDNFSDHVMKITSSKDINFAGTMKTFEEMSSEMHKKIVRDMAVQNLKRQAKMAVLQRRAVQGIKTFAESSSETSESEDDIEKQRRKEIARRHWAVIRRDIWERINRRKDSKKAGGSWNTVRAQVNVVYKAEDVRRDLYERYGIIPPRGRRYPNDVMKPVVPSRINDIVTKFQAHTVRSLPERVLKMK